MEKEVKVTKVKNGLKVNEFIRTRSHGISKKHYEQLGCNTHSEYLLFIENNDTILAWLSIIPLLSEFKQAVLLKGYWPDSEMAKALLKDAVKFSWESGYHVAFLDENIKVAFDIGFEMVDQFEIAGLNNDNIYGMELSWDGYKKISKNLEIKNKTSHKSVIT